MSCSSNRNRLVGSWRRTLVSRTNSFEAWEPPGLAGLRDGRRCRVDGAGRSLRSTMGLLGGPPARTAGLLGRWYPDFERTQDLVAETSKASKLLWWKGD